MPPTHASVHIADVMTSRVHTAQPSQCLADIWRILVEQRCHHVPIIGGEQLVGVISARDLVRVARDSGARKLSEGVLRDKTAADVMSTDLQTIHVDDPVEFAIDRIGVGDIHALLVVDDDDGLAGIVTHHDLLHYLTS
jgi:acetoin utilization protein AcuB